MKIKSMVFRSWLVLVTLLKFEATQNGVVKKKKFLKSVYSSPYSVHHWLRDVHCKFWSFKLAGFSLLRCPIKLFLFVFHPQCVNLAITDFVLTLLDVHNWIYSTCRFFSVFRATFSVRNVLLKTSSKSEKLLFLLRH